MIPENFSDPDKQNFRQWSRTVKSYCGGRRRGFMEAMGWAELQNVVDDETMATVRWDGGHEANYLLSELLIQLTGEEANLIVEECGNNGFDAWRKLCSRFDSYSKKHELDRIDKFMNVPRAKDYSKVAARIQAWEREMRLYSEKTKFVVPETWKTNILMNIVPAEYDKQLRMSFIRGETQYNDVRQTILDFVDEFGSKPVPMELGMLEDEAGLDALGRQARKFDRPTAAAKARAAAATARAKATPKAKATAELKFGDFNGKCYTCKEYGHPAWQCPQKGKPAGSLDTEDEENDDDEYDDSESQGYLGLDIEEYDEEDLGALGLDTDEEEEAGDSLDDMSVEERTKLWHGRASKFLTDDIDHDGMGEIHGMTNLFKDLDLESKLAARKELGKTEEARPQDNYFQVIKEEERTDKMKKKEYGPFRIVYQEAEDMTTDAASPKRKAPDMREDLKTSTPARKVAMDQLVDDEGMVSRIEWSPATSGSPASLAEKFRRKVEDLGLRFKKRKVRTMPTTVPDEELPRGQPKPGGRSLEAQGEYSLHEAPSQPEAKSSKHVKQQVEKQGRPRTRDAPVVWSQCQAPEEG